MADILYKAAEEGSHVDPHKIEQILGVPPNSSRRKSLAEETTTITGRCDSHLLRICELVVKFVTYQNTFQWDAGGGLSGPGGYLLPGDGVPGPGGLPAPGGCLFLGGGIQACTEADSPRGQKHRC